MVTTTWGWNTGWITVSLAAILFRPAPGAALSRSRLRAIGRALAAVSEPAAKSWPLPVEIEDMINDTVLWLSIRVRVAISLGIVFLMSVKPPFVWSATAILVVLVLGLISGLSRIQEQRSTRSVEGLPAWQAGELEPSYGVRGQLLREPYTPGPGSPESLPGCNPGFASGLPPTNMLVMQRPVQLHLQALASELAAKLLALAACEAAPDPVAVRFSATVEQQPGGLDPMQSEPGTGVLIAGTPLYCHLYNGFNP